MIKLQIVLGLASGLFTAVGLIPYLRDILRGKTKPERATWWIWLVVNAISLLALIASGATWSLGLNVAQGLGVVFIAILSLRYGYGSLRRGDIASLLLAAVGVGLWGITHQPLAALVVVMGIDFLGYWLTLHKTWVSPATETLSSWILTTIGAAFGLLAVQQLNIAQLLYPAYIFLGNGLLVATIIFRRSSKPNKREAP